MDEQTELEKALQTVQRLYMNKHKRKECVAFYVGFIQPIYEIFETEEHLRNAGLSEDKTYL